MKKLLIVLGVFLLIGLVGKLLLPVLIMKNQEQLREHQQRVANESGKTSVPEQTKDVVAPPRLAGDVVARPAFHYGKDDEQTTGTVFFLNSGKRTFLITASHLYKADEWETLRKIVLSDMQGQVKAECKGKPLHVGKYTEGSILEKAFLPDFKDDLIIHEVSENLPFIPLKLAVQLPAKGETVWIVGCESTTKQGQQLYPCKYLNSTEKVLMFKPVTSFIPADFSGAPVINQAGEVIGTLNGGNPNFYMGTPLSAIKLHAKSKAIEFE